MIEKAMKECYIAVKPNQTSKQQALITIGKLKETLPLDRAQMRIKVTCPVKMVNKVKKLFKKLEVNLENEVVDEETVVLTILMDPGQYRNIEEIIKQETQGVGTVEVLNLKDVRDDAEKME